jgi:hypothetical protein
MRQRDFLTTLAVLAARRTQTDARLDEATFIYNLSEPPTRPIADLPVSPV